MAVRQRDAKRLERRVQPICPAAERQRMPARREQRPLLDDGDAAFHVVVAVAAAEEALSPVHARPTLPKPLLDCEVEHLAFRRVHVGRPPPTAAGVQGQLAVADVHVGRRPARVPARRIERHRALGAALRRRRDLVGDHVDQPADGVRAVEQRGQGRAPPRCAGPPPGSPTRRGPTTGSTGRRCAGRPAGSARGRRPGRARSAAPARRPGLDGHPGWLRSVSPSEMSSCLVSSCPASTLVGWNASSWLRASGDTDSTSSKWISGSTGTVRAWPAPRPSP